MDKRFLLFLVLATLLLWANVKLVEMMNPPPDDGGNGKPPPAKVAEDEERRPLEAPPPGGSKPKPAVEAPDEPAAPRQWVSLGSADPASPYRMLVVATTRGGGIEWVGLNSEKYLDLDALFEKRGYLGYLALTRADGALVSGAVVNVVGPGSPAEGHLQPGDVITSIVGSRDPGPIDIRHPADLENYLQHLSRVGDSVRLSITRKRQPQTVTVALGKRPLELIKPDDAYDPALSFMLTLAELDGRKLEKDTGITFGKEGSDDGAFIDSVRPGSAAAKAHPIPLLAEDKVVKLDNVTIKKPKEFTDAVAHPTVPTGAFLKVEFKRGGAEGVSTTYLALPAELPGVRLQAADWQIANHDETMVEFRRKLPALNLEFVKRYTLAKAAGIEPSGGEADATGYHLNLELEIINSAGTPRKLAYQLDGPQGLPTEGWWYASKISREGVFISAPAGARDVVYSRGGRPVMLNAPELGAGSGLQTAEPEDKKFDFISVDARYFAVAMIPISTEETSVPAIRMMQPLVVGEEKKERLPLTNTSFRLITSTIDLADQPLKHSYTVFLGPKQKNVLTQPTYELEELIYYGWPIFAFVAKLMVDILHFFYWLIPNYGIAIILLTVLVRLCMFPLSRKQALGAQKMQKLQPEMKRLAEKHKNDYEGRAKAQRELFRKHNYSPMAGCLPVFLQLPIFIGLYKGLSLATELRQAPLIPGFFWCSDLSAPDRLFRWDSYLPTFLASETGWLGPYFNLLPIITIVLFLVQQKMFMPPPTDEQQAMQQKMMTYMMIFFGFMFFKVPSGLCIYFIASSLWGIAERKLLPKISHETEESPAPAAADGRKGAPDKGKSRGGADPQGPIQRTGSRLGDSALGKMFKNLSDAAANQPRTQAGKRRQKKRGKGDK